MKMRYHQRGFTLIEVVVAVIILGGSLLVLLGLQTSIVERTFRQSKEQKAVLIAREILSAIEVSDNPIQEGVFEGAPEDVIKNFLPNNKEEEIEDTDKTEFLARVEITNWTLPGAEVVMVMNKFNVEVSWGPNDNERVKALFFAPKDLDLGDPV